MRTGETECDQPADPFAPPRPVFRLVADELAKDLPEDYFYFCTGPL
ncbi:hypothetical protein [Mucilaginibacter terrenus]|nr:hypothetical protein [Mucilaginibacter terrenus]